MNCWSLYTSRAGVCIIDNTNLAIIAGTGGNAIFNREMIEFANQFGFRWQAHRIMHSDRKAGVERSFYTLETSFFPGRSFASFEDLNLKAIEWATVRYAGRPQSKTKLIPLQLFEHEKSFLLRVNEYLQPPYRCHHLLQKDLFPYNENPVNSDYQNREEYKAGRFSSEADPARFQALLKNESRLERERLARIARAKIPIEYSIETYPFKLQPELNRKHIMESYDSMNYIGENKNLLFIGPTGCGKTGLSTAFLTHALNHGYKERFIDFSELIHILYQSRGDHSEQKIVGQFVRYDVLLIDELGYISCQKEQASLFFDLLRRRHEKSTTIITTQLGFDEWRNFLHDPHIVTALLDRMTSNCTIFNMKDCQSIRGKKVQY